MAEINITQADADALLVMEKHRVDDRHWTYAGTGEAISVPLVSADKRENFLLDVSRGRVDLKKCTYQNRARHVVILARLDINGPVHTNPDGEAVPCPHLHRHREGYADKWAMPLPAGKFSTPDDLWVMLEDFMSYCNIVDPPHIDKGLFV